MKISKLFHWLYAILMLLPFLVFLPNAFYYGFNEHAVAQEKTEQVPVYYETNEVNNLNDIHIDSVYTWTDNFTQEVLFSNAQYFLEIKPLTRYQGNGYLVYNAYGNIYFLDGNWNTINLERFDFLVLSYGNNFNNMPNTVLERITFCSAKYIKEYQTITTNMSITDSMTYAWDSVWQNDLFSWSYGSFLTEPFIYIGNVFNVPADNSLYYALSYWLDISIIWLCFDMVMYIPLLVHRWLDKGIIE